MLEGFAIQLTNVSTNWKLDKLERNIVPAFNSDKHWQSVPQSRMDFLNHNSCGT